MAKITRRELWNSLALYGDPTIAGAVKPTAPKRQQAHPERDTLNAIMAMLRLHPKVAWRVRLNSGGFTDGRGQFVRFGFTGCPDIWGQMKATGKLLCIEVKSPTGSATDEQLAFLERVRSAGGHAGIARSVDEALAIVNA